MGKWDITLNVRFNFGGPPPIEGATPDNAPTVPSTSDEGSVKEEASNPIRGRQPRVTTSSCLELPPSSSESTPGEPNPHSYMPSIHTGIMTDAQTTAREQSSPDRSGPSISNDRKILYPDDVEARSLLRPIENQLARLKTATPESMPPPNPHIKTRSHKELVKTILVPIGEFIVHVILAKKPNHGEWELRLW
jgi:hypothetical protein